MINRTLVAAITLLVTAFTVSADETSLAWKAGSARVKITPEESMWMAGYASRNKPSEGVEQDLFAKALVIEDESNIRLVIVTTDLIGIPRQMRDSLLKRVAKEYGLPAASLVLNASHTHCGPELRISKASVYGLTPDRVGQSKEYVAKLEQQIVDLIGEAIRNLEPSRLRYTSARAGFAMNRRLISITAVRNSPNPQGPVDHEVPVLRVEDANGMLKTVLFGYACHNTTMGFYKFFGDYAGYAQQFVEEYHPDVNAMFFMGCGGDQNPYPRRSLEFAEHHGRALANAVETAIRVTKPREVRGPLRVAMEEVELKFASPPTRKMLDDLAQSSNKYDQRRSAALLSELDANGKIRDTYKYPVGVARLGEDLTIVTLSGEVVVDCSLRLKMELSGEAAVWVAGYSHDVFGYVPSRRVLLEGGYEGGGAMRYTTLPGPFDPSVEQRIFDGVRRLMTATK